MPTDNDAYRELYRDLGQSAEDWSGQYRLVDAAVFARLMAFFEGLVSITDALNQGPKEGE